MKNGTKIGPYLNERNFCVFMPCYNTARFIEETVRRIPWHQMPDLTYRVVFVDNQSTDNTWDKIARCRENLAALGIDSDAIRNPKNLSYGGSNKVIFDYCATHNFGLLGVLHSDGQYLPEELPRLIGEFLNHPHCALFYGSRLLGAPLEGGMPKYKYLANHTLTWIQNRSLGTTYSEFHSGYRFYRMNKIRQLPYHFNSDYFDFDNHIIFQIHRKGWAIGETYIPTFYGEEKSYVSPVRTPLAILANVLAYTLHDWGMIKVKRYAIEANGSPHLNGNGTVKPHDFQGNEAKRGILN